MENEQIIFTLIMHAGNARSYSFDALALARGGEQAEALQRLDEANKELQAAHHIQTNLLQTEAKGEKHEISLLLVHAQDHLMNAMLAKDLIQEMISMLQGRNTLL